MLSFIEGSTQQTDATYASVTTAPHGSSQCCHAGCQPVREYLQKYSSWYQHNYAHLHRVKLHMYLDDWLLNPGTHQEALEQTSWLKSLCRRLGLVFKPRENGSIPISGCHSSGDRAGHSCRPDKAITQESDQLAIRSGGIHGTAVTTCCPMTPSTWTPSLSRETSALIMVECSFVPFNGN